MIQSRQKTEARSPKTGIFGVSGLWSPVSGLNQGFTFVELLIAATMISILFVGLGAHLRGGLAVWTRATKTVESLQRQRVALDRLERDLAHAIVYDAGGVSYGSREGAAPEPLLTGTSLRFFTIEASVTAKRPVVRVVSYRIESINDRTGLWRTSQSVAQARAGLEAAPELLLPEADAPAFQYAYLPPSEGTEQSTSEGPLEWHGEWRDAQKELPRLVHCTLMVSGRTLQRTYWIPVGVLKPFETTSSSQHGSSGP